MNGDDNEFFIDFFNCPSDLTKSSEDLPIKVDKQSYLVFDVKIFKQDSYLQASMTYKYSYEFATVPFENVSQIIKVKV